MAGELYQHPGLSKGLRTLLNEHLPAFVLGKTAPDVQSISGQKREETHFYVLPPEDVTPAWQRMQQAHPEFSDLSKVSPEQAVFLTGYFCHLQADEAWLRDIFLPNFYVAEWADFRRRMYLHNVLRSYLDREVLKELPESIVGALAKAPDRDWLPFVEGHYMSQWRDYLTEQLQPGASIYTVEVFAKRQGIPVEDYVAMLDSEERMQAEVFAQVPYRLFVEYREALVAANLQLMQQLLGKLIRTEK
ncbi:MAG: hypothetical protein DWQ07_20475 [Chloroflexi bacterium]|nr:MAG: hypothetical protein DWQ07_20475 [Chloroflexota bacterium]MBL1194459.1 hypothetical protein [Chloroflexota bacterium]